MNILHFPKRDTPGLCPLEGADILEFAGARRNEGGLHHLHHPHAEFNSRRPAPLLISIFQFWLNWTKWVLWL